MCGDKKVTAFSRETVRHWHLDGFHGRHAPWAFNGGCYRAGTLVANAQCPKVFISSVAVLDPMFHHRAPKCATNPSVQVPEHCVR